MWVILESAGVLSGYAKRGGIVVEQIGKCKRYSSFHSTIETRDGPANAGPKGGFKERSVKR